MYVRPDGARHFSTPGDGCSSRQPWRCFIGWCRRHSGS